MLISYRGAKVNGVIAALGIVAVAASVTMLTAPASVSLAGGLELRNGSVRPAQAYFAGKRLTISLSVADEQQRPLRINVIHKRKRESVRTWTIATAADVSRVRIAWRGKTAGGRIAANGAYVVRAGPVGRPARKLGSFVWRRHAYPVAGPHTDRGYLGEYGAPRGGRRHEGFDINSPCGNRIVAARGGRVLKSRFDRRLMGNFVVIKGRRSGMRYLYAHLRRPSPLRRGDRVRTGQLVGRVGQTGNAASTPCHLHFELRRNGPIDPEPFLRRWDR